MGILTFWLTIVKGGDRSQGSVVRSQGSVRRSQGLGVRNWSSFRVFGVFRGSYQPRTPYSRQLRRATSRHKTFKFYRSSTVQAAQSSSISNTGGSSYPHPMRKRVYTTFHSSNLATGSKNVASFYSPALTLIQLCSPLHIDCHAATRIGLLSG